VSERFVRRVRRRTLDWSVEAQSLIDKHGRARAKLVRRLRRDDPELAARLATALEDARVETDDWPERAVAWFVAALDARAAVPELRGDQPDLEAAIHVIERGVDRVAALDPPPELATEHAALVSAQREYAAATRQLYEATAGTDAAAVRSAADRVQHARAAIDDAFHRLTTT